MDAASAYLFQRPWVLKMMTADPLHNRCTDRPMARCQLDEGHRFNFDIQGLMRKFQSFRWHRGLHTAKVSRYRSSLASYIGTNQGRPFASGASFTNSFKLNGTSSLMAVLCKHTTIGQGSRLTPGLLRPLSNQPHVQTGYHICAGENRVVNAHVPAIAP